MAENAEKKAVEKFEVDSANNNETDLTENELLNLLDTELNHDSANDLHSFQPLQNGLNSEDDFDNDQDHALEERNPSLNGAIEEDLVEADIENSASNIRREPSLSSMEGGEDDSVEADTYRNQCTAQLPVHNGNRASDAPESGACDNSVDLSVPEDTESVTGSSVHQEMDVPEDEMDILSGSGVSVESDPSEATQSDSVEALNNAPEDEMNGQDGPVEFTVPRSHLPTEPDQRADLVSGDAPESELSSVNHSSDAPPLVAAAPKCDNLAESPSNDSLNNAPEDEQNDVIVSHSDVTPTDDVTEDCPEDDQFDTSGASSSAEVQCPEADLASREQLATLEVASSESGADPQTLVPTAPQTSDQCCEPECDQSGNPITEPITDQETDPVTDQVLESIEITVKEDDFGDFVQSEPSSPIHASPHQENQAQAKKILLALADESKLEPHKLNTDDLVRLSRVSSNQSLDSCDVMARSLESEEDDEINVSSYRELLKRYRDLREQRENQAGLSVPTELESEVENLREELKKKEEELERSQEKLEHHDTAAKRTICQLQTEMKTRVDQVTKMYDEVLAEKDAMVVKFAQQELKNTEFIRKQEAMEAKFRDFSKDREVLISKLKSASVDKSKLSAQLHAKHTEVLNAQKEIHKLKDALSSQDVKVKWAHNKLKNEIDSHKETKTSLERTMTKLKEAREETETIRRNTQQMIKTYQESEDIKSNSLDQKLKEKMAQMKQEQQERRDQDEVHQMVVNELDSLKKKHKEALEEIQILKDKVITLDQERSTQEKCISSYRDSLQLTKRENEQTSTRLAELENIADERDRAVKECEDMRVEMERIQQQDKEYSLEAENCRARETQLLELTEKLTNKNAILQSENTSLSTKNSSNMSELEHLKNTVNNLTKSSKRLKEELHEQEERMKEEIDKLTKSLNEKTKLSEELKRSVEDKMDEIKVIKRRQTATIKDLTRQLQQARRRCETQESGDKADSLGSRTSSSNSLDALSSAPNHDHGDGAYSSSDPPTPMEMSSMVETPVVRHVEPDKQMLIERIVKLQRINARKSEKIEFLEDHINQLLLEIKKKNRLIQHYVTREESGALASNTSDNVKAQMSKRGGIMASLYSSHSSDQTMTLDLSLQINSKLQAVLEDTLLKNITLKENIDTLGAEIARLSQENRQLQLKTTPQS